MQKQWKALLCVCCITALLYIGYLHYKIAIYHRMVADIFAIHGAVQMRVLESRGNQTPAVDLQLVQKDLAFIWSAFHDSEGLAHSHSGREAWLYRLERCAVKYGDPEYPYPKEMLTAMSTVLQREEPEVPRIEPNFWDYPFASWWP